MPDVDFRALPAPDVEGGERKGKSWFWRAGWGWGNFICSY